MDLNTQLKPTVISNPHPLIGDGREYYYEGFRKGETLGEYVARVGVDLPTGSFVVLINGVVAMYDWKQYVLQEGDDIVFRSSALGGGGGGKVLRLVAMVAVAIVAAYAAPSLAGLAGFAEKTAGFAMATAGFSAAIMIGGTMLVNAIFPPPKPQMGGLSDKEQSPTYGISAGKNQASPYGPMLLVFGKHKVVPFLASKPYTTFVGDDQYLSQAFHLGLQPDLELEVLRIGDTNIEEYQNVEVNRSLHDGKLSLVSGNVDLLDGFELGKDMGWISRTTPLDTKHISVDVAANLYDIADNGGERNVSVTIEAQYRKVGTTAWLPMGGYTNTPATKYWSLGRWVTSEYTRSTKENDFTYTRRTWQQVRFDGVRPDLHTENQTEVICHKELRTQSGVFNSTRVEVEVCDTYYWRYIDHPVVRRKPWQGSAPDPYSGYTGTGLTKIQGKNPQKPTRHTIDVEVEKGQYEVRFRKVENDIATSRKSNKLTVAQIRCTQTDEADYTGQLRLAVRIKATSQLNGAIDELNTIASAKCPVWTGSSWEVKETSNPAWWFLWWSRGKRDTNYRRLYGECLPDNRIDIEAIKSWAEFCDRKGLEFNWVLDRKMTIEEVYYTIARAGRASTTWQTGKRGIIWDSDTLPVTTLLTPANIIAGSFSYKHINVDVADEIIVNYFDRNKDWEKAVVRQKVPNTQQTNNPITLDLEGCTSEVQAGREANLLAASQHYHRKQYSFEMDIEGAVLSRGDVAQLTHDLTSYASGGRLVAVNGNVLTLDYDVGVKANAWLSLRSPYNQLFNVRVNANGNKLTLINGWQFGDVGNVEDWLWQYDPVKVAGTKLQIKSVVPQSNGNVKFEAIEYVSEYFASENNIYKASPVKTAKDLPAIVVYDANTTERVLSESTGETEVTFNWVTSEMSNANVVVYREDEVLFTGRVHGYSVAVNAREGDTLDLEIIPFMQGRTSRTFRKSFVVVGTNIAVPAPTNLQVIGGFTKTSVRIKWDRVVSATGYEVQVLSNGAVRRTVRVGNVLTYSYNLADMQQDGGLVRSLTFKVRALGQRTSKSDWVEVSASNPQIGALQGIQVSGGVRSIIVTCNKPTEEDFDGYLWWVSDNASFTPTLSNVYLDGDFNQLFVELYNNQPLETKDYYVWCAGYDTFGKDSLNISGSFVVRPLVLKLDPQSIAEEMIKDGAFTINKFAENIKPPVVVSALPDVATAKKGDLVILESDSKLYRFDGTKWTSGVSADDLEGVLPDERIGNISANKLLGTIARNKLDQSLLNDVSNLQTGLVNEANERVSAIRAEAQARGLAITELKRQISEKGAQIAEVSQSLGSKIGSSINALVADLTQYKSTQAGIDQTQTNLINGLTSRIGTAEASIESINTTKASKTEVAALAQTSLQSVWKADARAEVDKMQVGGRNLLMDTKDLTDNKLWIHSKSPRETAPKPAQDVLGELVLTGELDSTSLSFSSWSQNGKEGTNSGSSNCSSSLVKSNMPEGTYTFSFYAKSDVNEEDRVFVSLREYTYDGVSHRSNIIERKFVTVNREWAKYTLSINIVSYSQNYNYLSLWIERRGLGTVRFKLPKLERGITPTNWSLAPEDIENAITETNANIASLQNTVSNHQSAYAVDKQNMSSRIGTAESSINDTKETLVQLDGTVKALRTVTAETTVNGRKVISGISLGATPEESSVIVAADKFQVVTSLQDGLPKPVFTVQANNVVFNGDLIANGSITTPKIAAGAVGADQLQANSITAKHLLVGDLSNLVLNGNQQFGLEGFSGNVTLQNPDSGSPTGKAIIINNRDAFYGNWFDVSGNEVYYFKFHAYRAGGTHQISLGLLIENKDNTQRNWFVGASKPSSVGAAWSMHEGFVTVPTWAARTKVWIQVAQGATETLTRAYMSGIEVRRVSGATMIQNGTILTQHMTANSINGDRIAANTIHGDKVTTNTLHGNKITAGTISASHIASRSITADKLVANTITASSAVIANGAIQTAHIANLSVDGAHIKNLAVDTLKIANNAVTRVVSYQGNSNDATVNITLSQAGIVSIFFCKDGIEDLNSIIRREKSTATLYVGGVVRKSVVSSNACVERQTDRFGTRFDNYCLPLSSQFSISLGAGNHAIRVVISGGLIVSSSPLSIIAIGTMK